MLRSNPNDRSSQKIFNCTQQIAVIICFQGLVTWTNGIPLTFQLWKNQYYSEHYYAHLQNYFTGVRYTPEETLIKYKVSKTDLAKVKDMLQRNLQPSIVKNQDCVMLTFPNIASPEWVSVNCDQSLIDNIICVKESKQNNTNAVSIIKSICPRKSFLIYGRCYHFQWFAGNKNEIEEWHVRRDIKLLDDKNMSVQAFEYLFRAVDVNFPPILLLNPVNHSLTIHTYERYFNSFSWKIQDISHGHVFGFYISEHLQNSNKVTKTFIHIYLCENGEYMSALKLCDNKTDCKDGSDETNERCMKLGFLRSNNCPPLFYGDIQGVCHKYLKAVEKQTYLLDFNTLLQNDLVADYANDTDEIIYKNILRNDSKYSCKEPDELPCVTDHILCYNITDICIYRLNELDHLVPCRTGNHLQDCREFQCTGKFKCPDSYCLPLKYINDGKWDCPGGADEDETFHSIFTDCPNLFRCSNSSLCVDLLDTCDGYKDCPQGDDELMCSFLEVRCPKFCTCLFYAIQCHTKIPAIKLPFMYINYSNLFMTDWQYISINFKEALFVNVSQNNLKLLCDVSSWVGSKVISLDVSRNEFRHIKTYCFANLPSIKEILLHNNQIEKISKQAFANNLNLMVLDLSHNRIQRFTGIFFRHNNKLSALFLQGNTINFLDNNGIKDLSLKKLITENYLLCCMFSEILCQSPKPWSFSCSNLFPSKVLQIFALVMSLLTLTLCLICIILHILKPGGLKAYSFNVICVILSNVLFTVYLIMIWTADFIFKEEYYLNKLKWRSSLTCFTAFAAALAYHLLTSSYLLLLALTRMILVVYPFKVNWITTKLISKIAATIFFFVVSFVSGIVVLTKALYNATPNDFCSPVEDPSDNYILIKVTTSWLAFIHLTSSICITILHIVIYKTLASSNIAGGMKKISASSILGHLLVVALFHILSTVPADIAYVSSLFMSKYSTDALAWITIAVVPINIIANSMVFLGNVP